MFNVVRKAWNLLLTHPSVLPSLLRQTFLFVLGALRYPRLTRKGVRIQWGASLMPEAGIDAIQVGEHSIIYEKARLSTHQDGAIEIGAACILGDVRIHSRSRVTLGTHVITSWNVFIQDFDPHPVDPQDRRHQVQAMVDRFFPRWRPSNNTHPSVWSERFPTAPISIGNNVWLGANTTILKGAHIGDDSIVSTGAIVTAGRYPARSILAGVPARVIKTL